LNASARASNNRAPNLDAVTTNGMIFARRRFVLGLVRSVTRATQYADGGGGYIKRWRRLHINVNFTLSRPRVWRCFNVQSKFRSAERAAERNAETTRDPRRDRRATRRTNVRKNTLDAIDAPPP